MCNTEPPSPDTPPSTTISRTTSRASRALKEMPPSLGGSEDPSSPSLETALGGAAWPEERV